MEEGHGEGLHRADHGDVSSKEAGHADGIWRAGYGDLISKKAMEAGYGDGLHRAEHGDLSSKKAMEKGHGDGLDKTEHSDLSRRKMEEDHGDGLYLGGDGAFNREKAMEEDGLRRAPHDDLGILEEIHWDGLHGATHGDMGIKMALEEGHGDAVNRAAHDDLGDGNEIETQLNHDKIEFRESTPPEPETPIHTQTSHKSVSSSSASHVHTSEAPFGTLAEHHNESLFLHGDLGTHANLAAPVVYHVALGEDVCENTASYGTFGASTHEIGVVYGSLRGDAHESSSAYYDASGQVAPTKIFANADLYSIKGQLARHPFQAMSSNGNAEGYAQGMASPDSTTLDASATGEPLKGGPAQFPYEDSFKNGDAKGNVHDSMTANNEFGANAHEKLTAYNEAEDVKVNVDLTVNSTESPRMMNFATKSGFSRFGSAYFTKQSGSMKNLVLALRIGGAIFSLIAFAVMISTTEKRVAAGSTFYVKFSDFQAYNYLAALNLLSFLYSSGQLILLAQSRSSSILSSPVKWGASVYLCDQMLAYLLVSSSSSAATASELSRHGLHNIWPPGCSTWKLWLFCSKADAAVVMSFMSFLFMLLSSFSSGYHLSKLLAE